MRKSLYSDEQIVSIVRESHAHGVPATSKKYKVSSHTIYIWRRKYASMEPNQVSEMKKLPQENARLKRLLAERALEIDVMKDVPGKNGRHDSYVENP